MVDFLSGCELTLEIYHSVSIYVPAPQAEQTEDGKLAISWKPATVTGATGAITYSVVCNMLSDMISVGESMRHVIDIRDAWYGQSVRISIRATCCGATATSSSSFVSIRDSVLTAPGHLKINGTDSYTGATAS